MNISTLIDKLQNIQDVCGDIPVCIYNDAWDTEHFIKEGWIVVKRGAETDKEYILRPSDDNPVWKKRVIIG